MSPKLRSGALLRAVAAVLTGIFLWWVAHRQPEMQPAPVTLGFLGRVVLHRSGLKENPAQASSPGVLEPAYEAGASIRLLLDPSPPERGECSPFDGGSVEMTLIDGDGKQALDIRIPLRSPYLAPASPGYLLPAIPASLLPAQPGNSGSSAAKPGSSSVKPAPSDAQTGATPGAATASNPTSSLVEPLPFLLPDRPGRWRLDLAWRCAQVDSAVRRSSEPFWVLKDHRETQVGQAFWARIKGVEALPAAEQVARFDRALEQPIDPETRMWALSEQFQALKDAGDFGRAELTALAWASAAEASSVPSEAVRAWNGAHEAARERDQLHKALSYLDRSNALIRTLPYPVRLPQTWLSYGILYEQLDQPLQALDAYARTQRFARQAGKEDLGILARVRELILLQRLGHDGLVNRRLQALLAQSQSDPDVINNLGWLILRGLEAGMPVGGDRTRALDRAETAFKESLSAFQARGNVPVEGNVLSNLAEVALWRRDAATAQSMLEEARRKANSSYRDLWLSLGWMTGNLQLLERLPREALQTFSSVERQAAQEDAVEPAGYAAFGKGEAYRALGDLEAAQKSYDRALQWSAKNSAVRSPLHRAATLASRALWEGRAVTTRLDRRLDLEALTVVEEGAWRRRNGLSRAAWGEDLPAGDRAQVQTLRAALDGLDGKLAQLKRLPPSPETTATLKQTEEQRQNRWAELEMKLSRPDAATPPVLSLEMLRSRIAPGGLMLRYALYPDELVVWEATRTTFNVRREPVKRSDLEQWIEQFSVACERGELSKVNVGVGGRLARLLLGPRLQSLPAQVTLVAEGALRDLPWAALPTPDPTGAKHALRPLVETTTFTQLPFVLWQAPARATSGQTLVVADPARDLPGAAREGHRLLELLQGAELLQREQATRAALLAKLPETRLFHYAGHGSSDPDNPYLSHLRLARDEWLTLMELQGVKLPGTMVFLNACEAGQVAREGGGALGLADGFLAAGADAVVASRWDVPDQSGGQVSSLYYARLEALGAGGSPAQALAETQRALLKGEGGPAAKSPAVWSAYFALGGG